MFIFDTDVFQINCSHQQNDSRNVLNKTKNFGGKSDEIILLYSFSHIFGGKMDSSIVQILNPPPISISDLFPYKIKWN